MAEGFLKIVNMSISASWLVLAVLVLRLCLKQAPRWIHVLLWGIVAVRLMCPASIESVLSLIPSAETISPDIMMDRTPQITTGISSINAALNPIITEVFAPEPIASVNPLQIWIPVTALFWIMGMAVMVLYTTFSYLRLRRRVRSATRLYGNIFRSAHIPSPFVLGIIRPRIYLPFGMEDEDLAHVIAHEQTHIRRFDHWWKPLGFLLLTIHWFNPLLWIAYILLCRDIELACDERVVRDLSRDRRADYSQALLKCSVDRRVIAACPLAFGEVGVRDRVKNVLRYQKPARWGIILAVILCIAVAVCFLTDPMPSWIFSLEGKNVADLDSRRITQKIAMIEGMEDGWNPNINADNFSLTLSADFDWVHSQTIRYFYFRDQRTFSAQIRLFPEKDQILITQAQEWPEQNRIFKLCHYLDALRYLPQAAIRQMCPDADRYILGQLEEGRPGSYDRVITYSADGVGEVDGWYIHLELQPLYEDDGAYSGTGDEVIHLFYGDASR